MRQVHIYAPFQSPRLTYVLKLIFTHWLKIPYKLTHHWDDLSSEDCCVCYGVPHEKFISIPACGLLQEEKISILHPATGSWEDLPVFFTEETSYTLPFDLLSAIFYLVSRQEEYYPHAPDHYGRYPAQNSILYQLHCLNRPLADEWLNKFYQLLQLKGISGNPDSFYYQPTYDIDIAYSYKYKGFFRTTGGFLRDFLRRDFQAMRTRASVIFGKKLDPYDCFERLLAWHQQYELHPRYFILSALQTTAYDKNNDPRHPMMQRLIKRLAQEGTVGMHPSFYAHEERIFQNEKKHLEDTIRHPITQSRQHYIHMTMPTTYQLLLRHDITDDFSMGYGTHNGFRAGTARSFPWYDLSKNAETNLWVHPFCFMDATAKYYEKLSPSEAGRVLDQYYSLSKSLGIPMITVFHNFSLGTDNAWKGWNEMYSQFLENFRK